MSKEFDKRRGEITNVTIAGGGVICTVEDLDVKDREYSAKLTRDSFAMCSIPPLGAEVIIEKIANEFFVTSIISIPSTNGMSNSDIKKGHLEQSSSISFVFNQREGAAEAEKVTIEYKDTGYVVDFDVDGDITLNAGGDIQIKEGGTTKKVLTEDAVFEYEDTEDTSDGTGSTTTKTTSKVSNGETTSVELE